MKYIKIIVPLVVVCSLLHFSPHIVTATEGDVTNKEEKDVKNVDAEEPIMIVEDISEEENDEIDTNEEESVKEDSDLDTINEEDINDEKINEETPQITEKDETNTNIEIKSTIYKESVEEVLKFGISSEEVRELKVNLIKLGFASWYNPTTYFGSETEKSVQEFQSHYELEANGIVDQVMLDKINDLMTMPLEYGLMRSDVVDFKEDLVKIGFATWKNPTNYFGSETEKAVRSFQKYYGLTVDGIMGQRALSKLSDEVTNSYKIGDSSVEIQQMKQDLVNLGIANWNNPTTYYGSETEKAVLLFQSTYGLNQNGIVDQVSLNKIEELLTKPLEFGMIRYDVVDFKEDLVKLGFANWRNPTNYFGSETEKAVRSFQKYYGLTVDGIMGQTSLSKLSNVITNSYKIGDISKEIQQFKQDLVNLNIANWDNPTTYFGSETEKRVLLFQSFYGLKQTGVVDEVTLNKIEEQMTKPLELGMVRSDVVEFKEDLVKLGFANWSNPTNYFGSETEKAVRAFQKYYGLTVDGIMGQKSLDKLAFNLTGSIQLGKVDEQVKQMKLNLVDLHFANWNNPTTYFGFETEKAVQYFQRYYGLLENGIADEVTLNKIEELQFSPLQYGNSNSDILEFKQDLVELGFANWDNPTSYYGPDTEKTIIEFQQRFGLVDHGIADEVTLKKIAELLENQMKYTQYNISLADVLTAQMKVTPQTDSYKSSAAYIHSSLLNVVETGVITGSIVNLRNSPDLSNNDNVKAKVTSGTAVKVQGKTTGDVYLGSNIWYEIIYNDMTLYVHESLVDAKGKVATTTGTTNVREATNNSSHIYGSIAKGKAVFIISEHSGTSINGSDKWYKINYNAWRNAKNSDTLPYLDPSQKDDFQHLLLSGSAGLTEKDLELVLNGQGILNGTESAFLEASKTFNVNEIYLVSHSFLETGRGKSVLANGVYVDKSGNTIRDSNGNLILDENKVPNGSIMVYNVFGIAAYDSNPTNGAAKYAFTQGWTSPKKAIMGGADWISRNYINHASYKQNTLYKMRWNPDAILNLGYASHQYATDIGWAGKQVPMMKELYEQLPFAVLEFDIVNYK